METAAGNSVRPGHGAERRPEDPVHAAVRAPAGSPRAAVLGSLTIPGRPEQVGLARAFVAQTFSSKQINADSDAATLLTSEVVTNAIQHTRSGVDGGTVTIVVIGVAHGVLIEIIDDGAAGAPIVKGDLYAAEGHGLFLVQHLATEWGYLKDSAGPPSGSTCRRPRSPAGRRTARARPTGESGGGGGGGAGQNGWMSCFGTAVWDGAGGDHAGRLRRRLLRADARLRGAGHRARRRRAGGVHPRTRLRHGRVTHPLVALGHPVVAVDESPEMLAHVRGAETVRARIEDLALGRRFDAVLLASHLINADDETRSTFLDACRRHVADDGCVIVQQHSPEWFAAAKDSEVTRDGVIYRLRDVSRPAPDLVSATVEYVVGDRCWTQTFTTKRLDDAELDAALAAAGLRLDRYLTEDRSWFRAVPVATEG